MGMTTNLNDPIIDRQIQHHTNQSHTLHVFFPSNIPVKECREFVSIEYSTTFEDYPPSLAVSRQYLKWPKHLAWSVPPTVKQYRPPSVWSLPQPFQQVDTCLPSKWLAKTHTEKEFLKKCIIQNIYCIYSLPTSLNLERNIELLMLVLVPFCVWRQKVLNLNQKAKSPTTGT